MFCKNCGNEIPDGCSVCGYCGTPVDGPADAGPQGGNGAGPDPCSGDGRQGIYGEPAPNYTGSSPNPNAGAYAENGGPGCGYNGNAYQTNSGQYRNPNPGGAWTPPNGNMDGGATGMAVTSMVLGIVALLLSCCSPWWLTLILGVVSIVLGILALNRHTTGRGMAIAGIVCSAIALVVELIFAIIGATFLSAIFSEIFSDYQYYNFKL